MSTGPSVIACSSVRTARYARTIGPAPPVGLAPMVGAAPTVRAAPMVVVAPMVGGARTPGSAWQRASRVTWWSQHREASLNWLALGLLLAAWNASDNEVTTVARRRPESLRGYSHVSVRAATLHSGELRKTATMDSTAASG
jgi:hypothetical protein